MDQDRAVKKILTSIKVQGIMPEEYLPVLRPFFEQVFGAGFDHRGGPLYAKNNHPVKRVSMDGKTIERFKNIKEARLKHKCDHYTILRSIQSKKPTRFKGYYWQYDTN